MIAKTSKPPDATGVSPIESDTTGVSPVESGATGVSPVPGSTGVSPVPGATGVSSGATPRVPCTEQDARGTLASSREANSVPAGRDPVPATRPRRVLVVGFGNPIRGDDAIGPMAAEHLRQTVSSPAVQILNRHVLTTELIAEVSEATLVIFIDAATGGPIGEVLCRPLNEESTTAASMAHFFQPAQLLAAARALYGNQPESYLVSVRGMSFDFAKYQLSPTVEAAFGPLIDKVQQLIEAHLDCRIGA